MSGQALSASGLHPPRLAWSVGIHGFCPLNQSVNWCLKARKADMLWWESRLWLNYLCTSCCPQWWPTEDRFWPNKNTCSPAWVLWEELKFTRFPHELKPSVTNGKSLYYPWQEIKLYYPFLMSKCRCKFWSRSFLVPWVLSQTVFCEILAGVQKSIASRTKCSHRRVHAHTMT